MPRLAIAQNLGRHGASVMVSSRKVGRGGQVARGGREDEKEK